MPRNDIPHFLLPHITDHLIEAGIDEAGRGCLAGPVVAAAVILPKDFHHSVLRDSKQLSAAQRESVRNDIIQSALAYGIGMADHEEIDRINIRRASVLAMHRAIDALQMRPELLLVDGNFFEPYPEVPHRCIIKGDDTLYSIAAAAVLAKTHRDALMREYAMQYPQYGWETNAAYPTVAHYDAIRKFGTTPLHRKTFKLHR